MRSLIWMCLLTLPLTIVACNGNEAGDPGSTPSEGASADGEGDIGTVLATVGDVQVGSKEFQVAASRKTPADGESLSLEERQEILDKLVTEKVLYQEAKKQGIDRDPKVQKVMINTLLREDVYSKVRNSDFSQDELRAYFEDHRDEFVVPEKVQVKRIFIKVNEDRPSDDARKAAADLRAQLVADPDKFKELATKHSEDPYRRRGGDLGFVSREGKPGIDSTVTAKAFELDVGELSEVFEAGGGMNIIMVANKREKVERTFEQMKGSVLRKVKNDKYKELYDAYVDQVSGDYEVEIDSDALSTLEIEPARRLNIGPGPEGVDLRAPDLSAASPGAKDDEAPEN